LTVGPVRIPLSVSTLAGQSPSTQATYAGVPRVTGVVNTVNQRRLDGIYGAPDTGQTPVRISGSGFAGQLVAPIEFTNAKAYSYGTQYSYTVEGTHTVKTQTVQQIPALIDVQLCTVTACSVDPPGGQLYLFPPGNPTVTSVLPSKGPAAGGTKVTIGGENLACPLYVFFGHTKAKSVTSINAATAGADVTCSSTTTVKATSPPGRADTSVRVSVETIESYFTGAGSGSTTATYTYT
jgi:hypothetical protein